MPVWIPEKKRLGVMLTAAALIASLTLAVLSFGAISRSTVIGSRGTVNLPVGVGFYWDSDCTNPVSFVDWGSVDPGSTVDVTIFARNEGKQAISLNITAENWNPTETTNYMIFSSNYMGQTINLQETLQLTLSLTTSLNIERITSFSFDIAVTNNPV